jgi:hypothetical protein
MPGHGGPQAAVGLIAASNAITNEDTRQGERPAAQHLVFVRREGTAAGVTAAVRALVGVCPPLTPSGLTPAAASAAAASTSTTTTTATAAVTTMATAAGDHPPAPSMLAE